MEQNQSSNQSEQQQNKEQQNYIQSNTTPQANNQRREIGDDAVWTLSSAKPGNGVDQLRDDNTNTFWQSDGTQPHYINIQFHKKMRVQVNKFVYHIDIILKLLLYSGNSYILRFQK
ncbi:Galactose-binding domain protein [Pseudocohnilembus persalinus]|uniref:Galactose-binding domain protein n=1 Tax=Pseudocohnilembus persalinus TaxID=266149 RepID=A0A0V0R6Y8_PSEPJ|nr:Galactose-binding domain protein [Pseudocohnilembus persalinus]|eukprot:KRX10263.1 Galactose-binding domain protein [Pseudocohnilembus persalinus]